MSKQWSGLRVALCTLGLGLSLQVYAQVATESVRSDGFAFELQGSQSHDTAMQDSGDWLVESKYNEQGMALRWEFANQWSIEGRASLGQRLRYVLQVGENAEGEPQFEDAHGRTRAVALGVGKRIWLNRYFSVRPAISYMWRQRNTPELYSDYNQQRLPGSRTQEHSIGASVAAEYRVIRRLAVSLNFTMLSSGERQQGIGLVYYFY